jgi:hypothetical protein
MGWYQLSKYYEKTDECPVYATAILLHPSKRARYIHTKWLTKWHSAAFGAARQIWEEYKDRPLLVQAPQSTPLSNNPPTQFQALCAELEVANMSSAEDELNHFIFQEPIKIVGTPLDWWCREEQRHRYPRLQQMAIDILSIPPYSDKTESVFSGVRRATSWVRGSSHIDIVEIQELLENWNKNGLLQEEEQVEELLKKAATALRTGWENERIRELGCAPRNRSEP